MAVSKCDFCSSPVEIVYPVPDSLLGMQVSVCQQCGLVQSVQTKSKPPGREVRASSGADWGNIRHGKGLRFDRTLSLLESEIPSDSINQVLDIGANRGDFVLWCHGNRSSAEITAVEPDPHIVEKYRSMDGIRTIVERIENVSLPPESFDLVYCFHTLEHARSAREMINIIRAALKPGGYLFLEVPNIEIIADPDIVEEFFIDKHTFHFNRRVLIDFLEASGFTVTWGREESDRSNVTLVLRKAGGEVRETAAVGLARANRDLIEQYEQKLKGNRGKLAKVAMRLSALADRQRVVCWGGGRIFDALVKFGGLEPGKLLYVIDKYLSRHLSSVHGAPLYGPDNLRIQSPDVVVVLAKDGAAEIEQEARRFGVRHVIKFRDLLRSA